MTLRIHSLRAGFATNSSSTHSVVLLPKHLVGKVRERASDYDDSFGWDNFVLCSPESKLRYLAAQFFSSYWKNPDARADLIERFAVEIPFFREQMEQEARDWNGKKLGMTVAEAEDVPLTVDHQSVLGFNPDKYDPNLVEMLIGFFKSSRVAVYGGNDNGNSPDPPASAEIVRWLHMMRDTTAFKVRKDGEFWSGFDTYSGTRIRWSFDGMDTEEVTSTYHKASAPELVDLKITDWCDSGCAFCYMGSTTKGKHAPLDRIRDIVKTLGEIDVFEIAIGGGEPTAHPDFPIILQMIRQNGMVPNFTTFTDKWLSDDTLVEAVAQYAGGIGVSCLDAKGLALVDKIGKEMRGRKNYRTRIVAQHVLGAAPLDVTTEFLRQAFKENKDVLLLGFKEVGFGKKHPRYDKHADVFMALALREITAEAGSALSVDTALVDQHPDLLKALKVPRALITSPEGKFSCYVDAVKGKMGASSYVQPKQMEPLVYEREAFLERFSRY